MIIEWRAVRQCAHGDQTVTDRSFNQESTMIWETPTAIDFRFGMEITMYADHR